MAYDNNQNEYGVPTGKSSRESARLLPRFYRTDSNKKFLQATVDQLTQSGTVKKINGYIGRQNAKASVGPDIFLEATDADRQSYQLEPAAIIKDYLGNVTFLKDYIDYTNQIKTLGGITNNEERLNKQEFYSWNPQIDWDKFVNFQQYYWLPYGPDTINIPGQQLAIETTYTITTVDEGDNTALLLNPDGLTRNPTLTLFRGQTYVFDITTPGHPISIKTTRITGSVDRYTDNVAGSAVESGNITFVVTEDTPDVLYYVSENDVNTGGVIQILDITENTFLDINADVIGKRSYVLPDGTALSNGMKVSFTGQVTPTVYGAGEWYVEGVGSSIQLINKDDLVVISPYSSEVAVLFDDTPFDNLPFSDALSYSTKKDYITIARASNDKNPWSRYNRWVHADVIKTSAAFNNKIPSLDQTARAKRPIIEFNAGIKLHNFGVQAKANVDLIDTFTSDVFSTIEGSLGYNIDGVQLVNGMRILFTADTDLLVKNRIFRTKFITVQIGDGTRRQLTLVEETDSLPVDGEVILVNFGVANQGSMFWFDEAANSWKAAQSKTSVNQDPLFDLFDDNNISFSNTGTYDGSTFTGNKIFSYKRGTSTADAELGFALSYKNISNIGDIVFEFNLLKDSFSYKNLENVLTKTTNTGFLKKSQGYNFISYTNGWITNNSAYYQPIVRIYKNSNLVNNFPIDVYDNVLLLDDLEVRVYINGKRLEKSKFNVVTTLTYKMVVLTIDVLLTDVVTLKCFSKQEKNNNGYYEIPVNLQNNPLNNDIDSFTLGQVIDHVDSIIDNLNSFSGAFPGQSNLRDVGPISQYGTKFVQHSGPLNMSLYHITGQTANIIKSIDSAREDYATFKRYFLQVAENSGIDTDTKRHVDYVLSLINQNNSSTFPYYLSDMVGYKAANKIEYTVLDSRISTYPITNVFDMSTLSNKSVNVYLNGIQLSHGIDYTFNQEGFVDISATLSVGDLIEVYEYESTDGCFIPSTPTKLGLWPKFPPTMYLDDTFIEPTNVIQGHDGSIVVAYGDYRDELLLELEKRIFNNIKINYTSNVFDIFDHIPGNNRTTDYSKQEFDKILSSSFFYWANQLTQDYTKGINFDSTNYFTYNYIGQQAPDGTEVPGYWRGVYTWLLDTDRPHITPWEMLGYTIKPTWWETVYGTAPYTSDNLLLWEDLADGIIREPGKPIVRNTKFVRPFLKTFVPVDGDGKLLSPLEANLARGLIGSDVKKDFVFGDSGPVEAAWRRSSLYPFAVIKTLLLMSPNKILGTCFDRSRIIKNNNNQTVYKDTNLRLKLSDIVLPSNSSSTARIFTSGLVNYIIDFLTTDTTTLHDEYQTDLTSLTNNLINRLGGFTSKAKFKLLLDSKSPTAAGSVYVPEENYNIVLNTSSPIKKLSYSGLLITKVDIGFEIKGYNLDEPYFNYYDYQLTDRVITVGGVSDSFTLWQPNKNYVVGSIVKNLNQYFRTTVSHTSINSFDVNKFAKLPELPVTGGRTVELRKGWNRRNVLTLPYGKTLATAQEVVEFIQGYGEYLKDQGFTFEDFNNTQGVVYNWETTINEFLFWTTQNWKLGSIIALSPSAYSLSLALNLATVNDIKDLFYGYNLFREDGQKLEPEFTSIAREDSLFSVRSKNTNHGIYGATFYLIQKEHVVVIDNSTLFNDTIYDPETGYRQERIKIAGFITQNWNGGFDIPGFVFDAATVSQWSAWTDYALGDVVKHKEFYYSAKSFLPGIDVFKAEDWIMLKEKPTSKLLPNLDYKTEQFRDFYDLDTDNFDVQQQKFAQHLIGYQKRQYLENIIKDEVSEYKFYQGMIQEKGTQNVLNKLFDVLSADNQESLTFNEEWALRVGEYGASDSFEEIEIILDQTKFKVNPQPYELVQTVDQSIVDFVIRQSPSDVYIKPADYNNSPWPVVANNNSFLRTPGYVRYSDVLEHVDVLSEITTKDILTFKDGDYVWTAFEGRSWNVYRFSRTTAKVHSVDYNTTSGKLTINFDRIPDADLIAGSIIGIVNAANIQGFHTISSVRLADINITIPKLQWSAFEDSSQILTFKFTPVRLDSIDNANNVITTDLKVNELIWTDNNGQGKWAIWKNSPVYNSTVVTQLLPTANQNFGKAVAVANTGKTLAVKTSADTVGIYLKEAAESVWGFRQEISAPTGLATDLNDSFGACLSFSADERWLAISAPMASGVKTLYEGDFVPSTTYAINSIVKINNTHWQAVRDAVSSDSTIDQFSLDWQPANLISATTIGTTGPSSQGMICLYERDDTLQYSPVAFFVSPEPVSNEQFGSVVEIAKSGSEYIMAISSPGYNSNQGRVYLYRYTIVDTATEWRMDYDRNYRGIFNSLIQYYANDIVFYNYELYKAVGTQAPGAFGSSDWEVISDKNILGYFPKQITSDATTLYSEFTRNDNVETILQGDLFGHDIALSSDGTYIVVAAPNADQLNYNNYKGIYNTSFEYDINDVVFYATGYYKYNLLLDIVPPGAFNPANWTLLSDNLERSTGKVFVYNYDGDSYDLTNTLSANLASVNVGEKFGESVDISSDGAHLAVGTTLADVDNGDQGKVVIFKNTNNVFNEHQVITSISKEQGEKFGHQVKFMNDSRTLVVSSVNGDSSLKTTFDETATTFDNRLLRLNDITINSGRIDIFDRYNENYIYAESLEHDGSTAAGYSATLSVGKNIVVTSAPNSSYLANQSGIVFSYTKKKNTFSWTQDHTEINKVNVDKIKKAFLYDKTTSKLITYLDIVDPIQGKIPGVADQELKYKTYYDPAVYSIKGTDTDVVVDTGMDWTAESVGQLWWDLTRAKFVESNSSDVVYRNTNWNSLYDTSSIDVYEWVESKILPSAWDKLADTEAGLVQGISGLSKYGDNAYSIKRRYDSITQTFKNTYYFWVKNKTIIPNVAGRVISSMDVADLISNPKTEGYQFIAFTSSNSFSLYNVEQLLKDRDVVLTVQYWIVNNKELNAHTHWKIISETDTAVIPYELENKWVDSLVGKDVNNRVVPDILLPVKNRYGIESRPRQGMFVNRFEALKQIIDHANGVLKTNLITDDFDLSTLLTLEPTPSEIKGLYDSKIDTDSELRFIGTSGLTTAILSPVIIDGRIIGATILNQGLGYKNAPYISVTGSGKNAVVKTVINTQGKVTGVQIINSGEGYLEDTTFAIRSYSVLVAADSEALNKWSIYEWNANKFNWTRTKNQAYDVTKFWNYIDWYANGYNQFTKIDHLVSGTYQIAVLEASIGETVKVLSVGTGGWLLLEKIANVDTIDYTVNYKVIGRQNGTIQFASTLYNFISSTLGYDGPQFDGDVYDNTASVELRYILEALKNSIFIDNLRLEYIKLFFISLRYVLHEQTFVDWIMKTSFVKAKHNVGALTQKVTYNNDNLENFEDYINEVKPYRTKIREYVSTYNSIDYSQSSVTDFDLQTAVIAGKLETIKVIVDESGNITANTGAVLSYPWKHWFDHVGFKISSIEIANGGSGYISNPRVIFEGGFGSGAEAFAYVSSGRVNRILIVNAGTGYLKAPTIRLDGGLSESGIAASAVAIIESEVVRSTKIGMRFDRLSKTYSIVDLEITEDNTTNSVLVGTGSRSQFPLKFSPDVKTNTPVVTVGGQDVLKDDFALIVKTSTTKGFTSYSGSITFATAPAVGEIISVTYTKNFDHLSATDRIQHYYAPTTGQLGKDFSQLMLGVDYGGVSVTGLGFGINGGWDSLPWFTDNWDSFDPLFDDTIIIAFNGQYTFSLGYAPAINQEINIYVSRFDEGSNKYLPGVRVDDPYYDDYDGSTIQPNGRVIAPDNTVMNTFVGNGTANSITLPSARIIILERDKVIFRKSTSDGSFVPSGSELDTSLTGGNLGYTTATGLAADDIILDGDGLITAANSHAPEEVVPGQVQDTLAIKVFSAPTNGSAKIIYRNYLGDGAITTFDIGQYPNSRQAVIVRVGNQIKKLDIDYSINWQQMEVELNVAPTGLVSVISFGFNGTDVLDLDYFVGDNNTLEFITNARYVDTLNSIVLVNGIQASLGENTVDPGIAIYEIFETDDSYAYKGHAGIRFTTPPTDSQVINYILTSSLTEDQTTSIVRTETVITDGSSYTYSLANTVGVNLPLGSSVIVRQGQTILKSVNSEYYTLTDNEYTYDLPQHKFAPFIVDSADIRVFVNGELLNSGADYTLDMSVISVTISEDVYVAGAALCISVVTGSDFTISSNLITFNTLYPANTEFEITSFYNHNVLAIQRTKDTFTPAVTLTPGTVDYYRFTKKKGGFIKLEKSVIADSYVWVIKNGQLLRHSFEYSLMDDFKTVKLYDTLLSTDVVQIYAFSSDITLPGISYMQFKDILNRVHYKRLNKDKQSVLTSNLNWNDTEISVHDGSVFTEPNISRNIPGVVEINGERIEYLQKDGNVLRQLRRGTLGTGIPTVHIVGKFVTDIGVTETIPYKDEYVSETFIYDGSSTTFSLNYAPGINDVEVFVGGYRLKKEAYFMHNVSVAPYSPEGDVEHLAQFEVDSSSNTITIDPTVLIEPGIKITVVKKIGKVWNDTGKSLAGSENNIAMFLKNQPATNKY